MEGMPRRPSASGDEGPSEPEKEKPLSRRTILKTYLAGAATVAPVIYEVERIENGNELAPAERHISKAERKSIAHLETVHAFYTIQFASHNLMSPPEVLNDKDALLLELVTDFD